MRKYGKWALTLGLLAATPAFTVAATRQARDDEQPAAKQPAKSYNQQMAEKIAAALKAERLAAFDVDIEFKDGTAVISGSIADPKQKQRARKAISGVAGVTQIDDSRLAVLPKRTTSDRLSGKPVNGVVQAGGQREAGRQNRVQQVNHEEDRSAAIQNNQQVADQIGSALSSARLDGYDIEIHYQNGVAMLAGRVPTNAQKAQATHVASQVPGVRDVANRLQVTEEPAMPERPAGPQMGYDPRMMQGQGPMGPGGPMMGPGGPMGYDPRMAQDPRIAQDPRMAMLANGVDPRMIPTGYAGPGGEMAPPPGMPGAPVPPAPYGHPGAGMSPASYGMPNLPEHAWPSYAQYPNSAAVTYPQQYSASAWPYIGPFYPYPQVPLGWRDATLRWDDGQWNLQFRQRTDKWFWFLHPRNW